MFVSHTSELRDFPNGKSYIAAVERAISACGHVIVDMADFPASDQPAAELCAERVRGCQVYVGVLGTRYGSPVPDKPEVSYTELEFDTATEAALDRLVFMLDIHATEVEIPPARLTDHESGARQEAFRSRVQASGLVTQNFTDPGTLGQLVERSLRELADRRRRRGGNQGGQPPICQLPATPADFSGRSEELAQLAQWLSDETEGQKPSVAVIHGMAGVGKTALVVRAGHLHADHFADGQLFADLHGHTAGLPSAGPGEVLESWLRAMGVPSGEIPEAEDARAALYRSFLASRRTLVVLDNAVGESQVRPLLPGTDGCRVLITSRHQLAGIEGAASMGLDIMLEADAVELFTRIAGADRVAGQEREVRRIVQLCGGLPLAVRIVGARMRLRNHWKPAELARRLEDKQRALSEFHVGDLSVSAAFFLSYQELAAEERRLFRLLSLHPGADAELATAAAAANRSRTATETLLDSLVDAHLVDGLAGALQVPRSAARLRPLAHRRRGRRCGARDSAPADGRPLCRRSRRGGGAYPDASRPPSGAGAHRTGDLRAGHDLARCRAPQPHREHPGGR